MRKLIVALIFVGIQCGIGATIGSKINPGVAVAATPVEQKVVFNTKTKKYHSASCKWAVKCTKNCITLTPSEAIKRGGVPCKVCGGS